MTRDYRVQLEVRPVADDEAAARIVALLVEHGVEIEEEDSYPLDDGQGYCFDGHMTLCAGREEHEAHDRLREAIGPSVRLTSRWLNLEVERWDCEFSDAPR